MKNADGALLMRHGRVLAVLCVGRVGLSDDRKTIDPKASADAYLMSTSQLWTPQK